MHRSPTQFLQSLGAAALCVLATAYALTFDGCEFADSVADLETARGEAEYVPVEVAATVALGVARALDYGAYSSVVHSSYATGQPITADGCIGIQVVQAIGADGHGALRYDFAGCPGQGGAAVVEQTIAGIGAGESWEDVVSSGDVNEDGMEDDLGDLLQAEADVMVRYDGYEEGVLRMSGQMALGGGVTGGSSATGPLVCSMAVSARGYATSLLAQGEWSGSRYGDDARQVTFAGSLLSAAGLEWTVMGEDVVLSPDCMGPVGGRLSAVFENDAGRVEMTATFDQACDGCADLLLDGVSQGRTCFAAASWLSPRDEHSQPEM